MIQSIESCKRPSRAEIRPLGNQAAVVDEIDGTSILNGTPTLVVCPDCGGTVANHKRGLPETVPIFDVQCPRCDVQLRRWCAVAVDAAYNDSIGVSTLNSMVERYWDRKLWSGITNDRDQPRNEEFTSRFSKKAIEFNWDWKLRCPLCRRNSSQLSENQSNWSGRLDYHHWSDSPDRGITLCRDCHEAISFNSYDNMVEKKAHEWGFRSRNDLQAICVGILDAEITGKQLEQLSSEYLVSRYNLLQSPSEIRLLISTVSNDQNLYEDIFRRLGCDIQ